MSENPQAGAPARARISPRIQAKNANHEDPPQATTSPEEVVGEQLVPTIEKVVGKVNVKASVAAKKRAPTKKKPGRPKGTTKAVLTSRAQAAVAPSEPAKPPPPPVEQSPPPYTPSVVSIRENPDEEETQFLLSQTSAYLSNAYAFISKQEAVENGSLGTPSVGNEGQVGPDSVQLEGDGGANTWGLVPNNETEVTLPTMRVSSRPSSRQVSAAHPTVVDHMSQIAEHLDDPDTSLYQPRPAARARSGTQRSVAVANPSDSESEPEEAVYEDLKEIPYMITVMKAYYPDTCSPTDWQGNVDKWAVKLGALAPSQVGTILAQRPIFAIRTADKAATVSPTIVLDEKAWLSLIREANEWEKKILLAEKRNLRSKPKSMLPFYISEVGNPREQANGKGAQGKGSGKAWAPKGPGSRDTAPALFGGITDAGYLRSVLQGQDTSSYELDRGQRNDQPFADGHLNTKWKSNSEYKTIIYRKYKCTTHGVEAMCYVPPTGEFVGQHLRIDGHAQLQLVINHMRTNPGFKIQDDVMPSSIVKQLVQAHRDYLGRRNDTGAVPQQVVNAGPAPAPAPAAPAVGQRTRALLNRPLAGYPDIGESLTETLGAQTIGELLLMIYEDVDVAKDGEREKVTASEVISHYIKQSEDTGLPRVLATLMMHAFEAAAKEYESMESFDFDGDF